jgi:DNA transformation protein
VPKNSHPYLDFLIEAFAPLGQIHSRAMFGGHCLYCDGTVFALVAGQAVYLKTDSVNRPAFEALGLSPFRPFADQEMVMQYYAAPAETFESIEGLREWAGGAIAASLRARKPAKRKKAVS